MQRIRWERRAQFGSTRKKLKRNLKKSRQLSCTTALHRRLGRAPQSGPRSRFTDSWWRDCTSPPRQLPPKPWWRCPAPAKAMTQFSRKSLKVKVQWTWAPRPLPPSTMPSTIPLSQAAPHPIHPLIPSKQQSLNKSNICSLKQALDGRILQCHNHWKDLCMHLKSLSICIIANYRVENTGSCQTTHEECLKTAKFQNVSLKPLKGAIWSCKTREHPRTNFV